MTVQMTVLPPNAVSLKDGHPITTSLKVAEVFGKEHSKVLKAIKALDCSEEFAQANFGLGSYLDKNNQPRPMYEITRDGFTFLGMGFTGPQAARFKEAYIAAFSAMASALGQGRPPLPAPTPKMEIEETEYWRMKAELAELRLEKLTNEKRKRNNPTRQQEEDIIRLVRQGCGPTEISKKVSRPLGGVKTIIKRLRDEGRL